MADNYFEFPSYNNKSNLNDALIQLIGYNLGDKLLQLTHNTDIIIGGANAKSLHLSDDSTSYQNTTGNTVYAIVTPRITTDGTLNSYKLYSAPTDNSVASAIEVFDLADFTVDWDISATFDRFTSSLVAIQNNHFIVLENTGTGGSIINVDIVDVKGPFALVVEPV